MNWSSSTSNQKGAFSFVATVKISALKRVQIRSVFGSLGRKWSHFVLFFVVVFFPRNVL